jgi:hypothetical protein
MKKVISLSLIGASLLFAGSININKGWNLVGAVDNIDPTTLNCAETVWTYDSNTSSWNLYQTFNNNTNFGHHNLNHISQGQGFWIKSNCATTLEHSKDSKKYQNMDKKDNNNNGENHTEDMDKNQDGNCTEDEIHTKFNLADYNLTTNLSQDLKDSLAYMGNEERLAYDVYSNLYTYHKDNNGDEIKQLTNIAEKSEIKHIGIVQSIVQRYNLKVDDLTNVETAVADNNVSFSNMPSGEYDIPEIQSLYEALYNMGTASKIDALKVGCMVEVTDINDLDDYIKIAEESKATDIIEAFKVLRDGSYKHYWAFDKGLKNEGIETGCFDENSELLTNKDDIYPKSDEHNKSKSDENEKGGKGKNHTESNQQKSKNKKGGEGE